ncbi:hypothetical protein B0H14DRAFT_3787757 [Mycena olivaceomarginata]|nr:hypothetical protein B0H14DRAFT_3787757 [Mycena olivaceomarginata]
MSQYATLESQILTAFLFGTPEVDFGQPPYTTSNTTSNTYRHFYNTSPRARRAYPTSKTLRPLLIPRAATSNLSRAAHSACGAHATSSRVPPLQITRTPTSKTLPSLLIPRTAHFQYPRRPSRLRRRRRRPCHVIPCTRPSPLRIPPTSNTPRRPLLIPRAAHSACAGAVRRHPACPPPPLRIHCRPHRIPRAHPRATQAPPLRRARFQYWPCSPPVPRAHRLLRLRPCRRPYHVTLYAHPCPFTPPLPITTCATLHVPSPARGHFPNTMCPSLARLPVADAPLPSPSRPTAPRPPPSARRPLHFHHCANPNPASAHPSRSRPHHSSHRLPRLPCPRRCVYPAHSSSRPNVATAPRPSAHATAAPSCPSCPRLPSASIPLATAAQPPFFASACTSRPASHRSRATPPARLLPRPSLSRTNLAAPPRLSQPASTPLPATSCRARYLPVAYASPALVDRRLGVGLRGRLFAKPRHATPRRSLAAPPPSSPHSGNPTIALTDGVLHRSPRRRRFSAYVPQHLCLLRPPMRPPPASTPPRLSHPASPPDCARASCWLHAAPVPSHRAAPVLSCPVLPPTPPPASSTPPYPVRAAHSAGAPATSPRTADPCVPTSNFLYARTPLLNVRSPHPLPQPLTSSRSVRHRVRLPRLLHNHLLPVPRTPGLHRCCPSAHRVTTAATLLPSSPRGRTLHATRTNPSNPRPVPHSAHRCALSAPASPLRSLRLSSRPTSTSLPHASPVGCHARAVQHPLTHPSPCWHAPHRQHEGAYPLCTGTAVPSPHLPAPLRIPLSARLSHSASIAQLYPPPAPVLLLHSGAVKPLRADKPVASHIHVTTGQHSLAVPPKAWTHPSAMYLPLPLRPRCPGPLSRHASFSRCALPAPSVLRSLLLSPDPRPPHIPSPSQLRASPAPRLPPLRPALYIPNRTSRVGPPAPLSISTPMGAGLTKATGGTTNWYTGLVSVVLLY